MKHKKQKNCKYLYSFQVIWEDDINLRFIITRNNIPYCQFFEGVFMDPNGVSKKDNMSITEKVLLWKHMNRFHDNVVANTLELLSKKNVFML